MKAPGFWAEDSVLPCLLAPFGEMFRLAAAARHHMVKPVRTGIPVICVGNLVVGGAGKTPVTLSIGDLLQRRGHAVAFLSRGYHGRERGPLLVVPDRHRPKDVGDEALLLAEVADTWVARDRAQGAAAARDHGAEVIVMDDGFQNPALQKTCSFVVVDGGYGFGNRRLLPAGPLREPLAAGLARADALLMIGADRTGALGALPAHLPVLAAMTRPADSVRLAPGQAVYGFAGIARPEKFRDTLESLGVTIAGFRAFPDHYRYSNGDLADLLEQAAKRGARPVTTAKDHVRLPVTARQTVDRIDIRVEWQDPTALMSLLSKSLASGPH